MQGFRTGRGSQEIGGSFVLGAWAENSLYLEPIGRKHGGPVRLSLQCKDLPPSPDFTLRLQFEGPPHDPTCVRLVVEEITVEASTETDEVVYQALATLPPRAAVDGTPGVPLEDLLQATKKADRTVRRALDRLIDAGRCLVTGVMTKQKKLYGVKINESA